MLVYTGIFSRTRLPRHEHEEERTDGQSSLLEGRVRTGPNCNCLAVKGMRHLVAGSLQAMFPPPFHTLSE